MKPGGQRIKGRAFEQKIAKLLRERWPGSDVHRSSQADRARDADVVVKGGPPMAKHLWLELQDARHPTPAKKIEQAERDIGRVFDATPEDVFVEGNFVWRRAVCVWHKIGEREVYASLQLGALDELRGGGGCECSSNQLIVTMSLDSFLAAIEEP